MATNRYSPPGYVYSDSEPMRRHEQNSFSPPRYALPRIEPTLNDLSIQLGRLNDTIFGLQLRLTAAEDIQKAQQLLSHYAALHNAIYTNSALRPEWGSLFAEDGVISVHSFGSHAGQQGKEDWAFGPMSYFGGSQLLIGNPDVKLMDDMVTARVRSDYVVHWVKGNEVLGGHYGEGGFNHWVLRRNDNADWAIQGVSFAVVWTTNIPKSNEAAAEKDQNS